jgi:Cu(I)/Ag(I) efflux system membrane fusion protein
MPINRGLLWKVGLPMLLVGVVVAVVALRPRMPSGTSAQGNWTCSMHPQVRQPGPGRCPICGMDLIPVGQLSQEQDQLQQRAGLETEAVTFRELFKEIRTVGKLDYNERRVAFIAARIAGRVDRVYADFTGIQVKPQDHLVDIYSPDLFVAQDELIRAVDAQARAKKSGDAQGRESAARLLEAARTKLRLWGMLPEQITDIETSRQVRTHLTIHAPIGGTVIEKNVREGQYVKEGDMLYRIADLDPIWLYLDIYEYDLGWVRYGQQVDVTVEAYPGEVFRGTVTFIDPFLDDRTRAVKVRVNLKNPDRRLKPAMYASATIRVRLRADGTPEPTGLEGKYMCPMHPEVVQDQPGRCSICEMQLERVPAARPPAPAGHGGHEGHDPKAHKPEDQAPEGPPGKFGQVLALRATAVLDTGRRKVAYRLREDGAYELVEVLVGPRAEGKDDSGQAVSYFPVLKGLKEGDRVVVRGGFLLDSQQQISGMPSLLFPQGQSAASLHSGHGLPPPQGPAAGGGHKH